jgi:hypothetical protein
LCDGFEGKEKWCRGWRRGGRGGGETCRFEGPVAGTAISYAGVVKGYDGYEEGAEVVEVMASGGKRGGGVHCEFGGRLYDEVVEN